MDDIEEKPKKPSRKRILVSEGPVFNEYNCDAIYRGLKEGLPYKTAVELCGISFRTARGWLDQGKQEQIDFEDECLPYQTGKALYYTECLKNSAYFIAQRVKQIVLAGKELEHWKANQYLLGVAENELFGTKQTIKTETTVKNKIVFEYVDSERWVKAPPIPLQVLSPDTMEATFVEEPCAEPED
jgi:hypothetical protein